MAMTVNNVVSNYTYSYNSNMRAKFDKDDNAVWDRSELENYAKDYNTATGKTLDVDKLFEKYANDDGVIDYAGQNQMHEDDALGFSVLKSLAASASTGTTSTSDTSSTTSSNTASSTATTMNADQRGVVYGAVNAFTYQYGNKLEPLLDKNSDGMWNRDELTNYANAYNKATGKTLDVDALMEKYANEDGFIDPTKQSQMKKDDALGLTALKTELDKANDSRALALRELKVKPYAAYTEDTTISGKIGSGDYSMASLLSNMSSSQKMAYSAQISRLDNNSSLLNSFGFGIASGNDMYGVISSLNSAQMYGSASTGKNSDAVYAAMSGQLMNFTL